MCGGCLRDRVQDRLSHLRRPLCQRHGCRQLRHDILQRVPDPDRRIRDVRWHQVRRGLPAGNETLHRDMRRDDDRLLGGLSGGLTRLRRCLPVEQQRRFVRAYVLRGVSETDGSQRHVVQRDDL